LYENKEGQIKFAAPNLLKPFNERLQKLIFKNVFLNIKIYIYIAKQKKYKEIVSETKSKYCENYEFQLLNKKKTQNYKKKNTFNKLTRNLGSVRPTIAMLYIYTTTRKH